MPRLRLALTATLLAATAGILDLALLRSLQLVAWPRALPLYEPGLAGAAASRPRRADAPAAGVTLVMVDGLRLERARELPNLARLGAEGAQVTTRALFPTFTRVGYATMTTGAAPREHGFLANLNTRHAKVPSIFDQARAAGVRTRYYYAGRGYPAVIFPQAFDRYLPLPDDGRLPPSEAPHLTFVYIPEPDATAHKQGGAGEAYREASARADDLVGRIAASLDLGREALVIATDHGHLDRGGHGGHEPLITDIPLTLVGAGVARGARIGLEAGSDLRDVAPTIALLLGIDPPPTASGLALVEALAAGRVGGEGGVGGAGRGAGGSPGSPPRPPTRSPAAIDPAPAPAVRAGLAALGVAALALACLGGPGALAGSTHPRREALAVLAAPALFLAVYALAWDRPLSFSCVNSAAEVVGFVLKVQALACACAALGAVAAGGVVAFAAPSLIASSAVVAGLLGYTGLRAPLALAHPATAFFTHMATAHLTACALVALVGAVVAARAARPPVEPAPAEPPPPGPVASPPPSPYRGDDRHVADEKALT